MNRINYREIFEGIRREDGKVLHMVYKDYFPSVRQFILKNSGSEYDAQDMFQDAMVVIYLKVKNKIPELSCTFGTYLFSIAKFLWYKQLRRRNHNISSIENLEMVDYDQDFIRDYIKMEKRKLVIEHFYEMGEDCRKILTLFIQNTPVDRITKIMGFSSHQYTRNRRTKCKAKLVERIWNSPYYTELRNEAYKEDSKIPRW